MSRFDYVKYDDTTLEFQEKFRQHAIEFEKSINSFLLSPRAKALALTKLEELYMWVGKALRDDQIECTRPAQETRTFEEMHKAASTDD